MPTLCFWIAYTLLYLAVGLSIRDGLDQWLWLIALAIVLAIASWFIPYPKEPDDGQT